MICVFHYPAVLLSLAPSTMLMPSTMPKFCMLITPTVVDGLGGALAMGEFY